MSDADALSAARRRLVVAAYTLLDRLAPGEVNADALAAAKAGLRLALAEESMSCTWRQFGPEDEAWETDCGNAFSLVDGGPSENGMRFCPYCGRPLREVVAADSDGAI